MWGWGMPTLAGASTSKGKWRYWKGDGRPGLAIHCRNWRLQLSLRAAQSSSPGEGRRERARVEVGPGMSGELTLQHSRARPGARCRQQWCWEGFRGSSSNTPPHQATLAPSRWEVGIYVSSPWNWTGLWLPSTKSCDGNEAALFPRSLPEQRCLSLVRGNNHRAHGSTSCPRASRPWGSPWSPMKKDPQRHPEPVAGKPSQPPAAPASCSCSFRYRLNAATWEVL